MRNIVIVVLGCIMVAGCTASYPDGVYTQLLGEQTAPGAPLPGTMWATCTDDSDPLGRCKNWTVNGSRCIHPKGIHYDVAKPLVPCSEIKK